MSSLWILILGYNEVISIAFRTVGDRSLICRLHLVYVRAGYRTVTYITASEVVPIARYAHLGTKQRIRITPDREATIEI
jgi:hypothetical protein